MAKTKFTPGPWWTDGEYSADECGVSVIAARADCGPLPGNPTRGMVAFVSELLPENADRARANAHLIAAAPELYEALERLIKAGTDAFNAMSHYAEVNNTTNAVSHNLSGALDFGLFQLAKARGEAV